MTDQRQLADYERLRQQVAHAVSSAVSGWAASETWDSRIRAVDDAVERIMRLIDGSGCGDV